MNLKETTQRLKIRDRVSDSVKFTKQQQEFFDNFVLSMKRHKKLLDGLK